MRRSEGLVLLITSDLYIHTYTHVRTYYTYVCVYYVYMCPLGEECSIRCKLLTSGLIINQDSRYVCTYIHAHEVQATPSTLFYNLALRLQSTSMFYDLKTKENCLSQSIRRAGILTDQRRSLFLYVISLCVPAELYSVPLSWRKPPWYSRCIILDVHDEFNALRKDCFVKPAVSGSSYYKQPREQNCRSAEVIIFVSVPVPFHSWLLCGFHPRWRVHFCEDDADWERLLASDTQKSTSFFSLVARK